MSISAETYNWVQTAIADPGATKEVVAALNLATTAIQVTPGTVTPVARATMLATTYTTGSAPTTGATQTVANAATPTVAELLQFCANLQAEIASLNTKLVSAGVFS